MFTGLKIKFLDVRLQNKKCNPFHEMHRVCDNPPFLPSLRISDSHFLCCLHSDNSVAFTHGYLFTRHELVSSDCTTWHQASITTRSVAFLSALANEYMNKYAAFCILWSKDSVTLKAVRWFWANNRSNKNGLF